MKPVVKSADRVLDVLEVLAQKRRPLTHAELSMELGIPKSSLSQLLGNLVERGYVVFTPGPNSYALGPRLIQLTERQYQNLTLPQLAQPLCDRVTRLTGESSSLNMRQDDAVQRVCGANSTQPLTFAMSVGELAPMYAVSSGKVLLAWLPDDELAAYLARTKLAPVTKRTITSATSLHRELQQVRKTGAAWSIEEFTPGIIGVAVPAFHAGALVGAFNIATPSVRDNSQHRKRLVSALRDAAASLEKDLDAADEARRSMSGGASG